jgi:hypothetical protein
MLGEDWRNKYFGQGAVFEGRDKLLAFLISDQATNEFILHEVRAFFTTAGTAHNIGASFKSIDALGMRIAGGAGSAVFGGLSYDEVLNLTSGEFSVFLSPEAGFIIGESATVMGGLTLLKNLPSNDAYRGTFEAVGIVGGNVIGLNAEGFWGAPLSDRFTIADSAHGYFIGAGLAVPGLGGYGSISYSYEAFREDKQGSHWLPQPFNALSVAKDIGWAITHDILLHPILPWSPYWFGG